MIARPFFLYPFFLVLSLLLSSCHFYQKEVPSGQALKIQSVYANPTYLHKNLFNVLLLPLEIPLQEEKISFHHKEFIFSLLRNFGKFHYFHIQYDPHFPLKTERIIDMNAGNIHRMRLGGLQEQYGVQAVLIVSISDYVPYFPMRMKVHALLIDTNFGTRIWEFNHTFQCSDSNVMNSMRIWWNSNIAGSHEKQQFESALLQPTVFADFIFYTMAQSYGKAREENKILVEKARKKWEKQRPS